MPRFWTPQIYGDCPTNFKVYEFLLFHEVKIFLKFVVLFFLFFPPFNLKKECKKLKPIFIHLESTSLLPSRNKLPRMTFCIVSSTEDGFFCLASYKQIASDLVGHALNEFSCNKGASLNLSLLT